MFFRSIWKTLIGFVTCTIIVLLLIFILWPTFDQPGLVEFNQIMVDNYGSGGHFAIGLLSLLVVNIFLPIDLPDIFDVVQTFSDNSIDVNLFPFSSTGMYILILAIWLIGSFAGGLASRGGLRSGAWSAMLSFVFLDLIFSIMVDAMEISVAGFTGSFFTVFFFTLVVGSFIFIPVVGLAGGIAGGILGKMLFRKNKDKSSKNSISSDKE